MAKRRHLDEPWPELVGVLSRLRKSCPTTLADAQRLFDAVGDMPLSSDEIQSMAADLVRRFRGLLEPGAVNLLEQLLFTADALPTADICLTYVPDLIGMYGLDAWADYATAIDSTTVDTRRLAFPRPMSEMPSVERDAEVMVLNVWPCFDELDRFEFRRVRQGTLRWDACLDGRGLEDSWRVEILPERHTDAGAAGESWERARKN